MANESKEKNNELKEKKNKQQTVLETIVDVFAIAALTLLLALNKMPWQVTAALIATLAGVRIKDIFGGNNNHTGGITALLVSSGAVLVERLWSIGRITALCLGVLAAGSSVYDCGATPKQVVHASVVTTGTIVQQLVNANEEQYRQATQGVSLEELEPYETEFTQRVHALAAMSSALFVAASINDMVGVSEQQRRIAAVQATDALEQGIDAVTSGNVLPALSLTQAQRSYITTALRLLQTVVARGVVDSGVNRQEVFDG